MMKRNKKKTYEALGFVESLIAIMIVGISSVVLMRIAANTMQNVMQNEAIDNMTQFAVEGAEIVQDIANRNKILDEQIFPPIEDYIVDDNCFALDKREGEDWYSFKKEDENFVKFTKGPQGRETYRTEAVLDEENDEFFRIVCLQPPEAVLDELIFVIAEIVVGQRHSDGTISKGNLVKDYEYRSIIKFLETDDFDTVPVNTMESFAEQGKVLAESIGGWNSFLDEIFPPIEDYEGAPVKNCFVFKDDNSSFKKKEGEFVRYTKTEDRDDYKQEGSHDEYFRIVCMQPPASSPEDHGDKFNINATIVVGQRHSDGVSTRGGLLKDYEIVREIKNIVYVEKNEAPIPPTNLKTEGETNPTISTANPKFSAIFNDPNEDDESGFYQIQVNTQEDFEGTMMWDSNKTSMPPVSQGSTCDAITYGGNSLNMDGTTYYWQIRFWDFFEEESPWPQTANFTTQEP